MSQSTRSNAAGRRDARAAAAAPDASGVFTHRQIVTILIGLVLGMFLAALDQTVVSTAIRTIADDLNGYDLQAWATTAFLITSTIATPLYGKLSDLYGRRPFYLFAIGVFVIGSLACAFADSMYQLAAFRALQGIGAGGLMSLALAIIGDIVPPRERSRYQGFFMAVFGTSSVLGPVIGGFLAGQSSIIGLDGWRWIFFINVPLGILAFVVVSRVLHLPHTRRDHRIDWPGAVALIVCLVPLLIVAEQGRTWGWDSGRALLCYGIGVVGLIAFILAERAYKDDALIPLRMFTNRSFAIGSVSSIVLEPACSAASCSCPSTCRSCTTRVPRSPACR
jgi:EmrB/QacA subfamily drug resistance transporter